MGVPGLWDILRPAGQQRSLTQLAVHDGFELNPDGRRGLRVGIDASIWFYHAQSGREGENPELRLLFFRCARLMSKPFLPLFVFDGPRRPELKRKKKVSGKDHWMISGMQEIIEAFGFEYWCAPGEAEAELAYLNRIGIIDAIITDDVDTFLFGATSVIRNNGKLLTGNNAHVMKNAAGKDDGEHTYTYSSTTILTHPDIGLSVEGLILIALLCGGDYDTAGLADCGANTAHGLARCGFGESLLRGASTCAPDMLPAFLESWRAEIRTELRTNARGFLKTKKPKLARTLGEDFPPMNILRLYTHPETSERKGRRPECTWEKEPDLGKLAALCERKFEWGVRELIVKRFRTVVWAPAVLRILRRAVLDKDAAGPSTPRKRNRAGIEPPGTPSRMITQRFSSQSRSQSRLGSDEDEEKDERLIRGIHGKRTHASTDGMPEYRLEIAPAQLVRLTETGVLGTRTLPEKLSDSESDGEGGEEEDGECKKRRKGGPPPDPVSHLRVWMPACIVERVEPGMVASYERRVMDKEREKEEKAARKAARAAGNGSPVRSQAKSKPKPKGKRMPAFEEEEELEAEEDFSHVFGISGSSQGRNKGKGMGAPTTSTIGKGKGKGKMGSRLISNSMSPIDEDENSAEGEDAMGQIPLMKSGSSVKPGLKLKAKQKPKAVPLSEATNSSQALDYDLELDIPTKPKPRTPTKVKPLSKALDSTSGATGKKSIFELLEERHPTRSVPLAPRSVKETSIASGSGSTGGGKRLMVPRPFPMTLSLSDEEDEDLVPVPYRAPLTQSPQRNGSRRVDIAQRTSGRASDSKDAHVLLSGPNKPPFTQKRGKVGLVVERDEYGYNSQTNDAGSRAGSDWEMASGGQGTAPFPVRVRPSSSSARNDIQNVVSSSPGSTHGMDMFPATIQLASSSRSTFVVSTNKITSGSQIRIRSTEVIEITSSSESEGALKPAPVRLKAAPSKKPPTGKRVDDAFRTITGKKKIGGTTSNKVGTSQRRPIFNMDEVIEID